MDEPTAAEPETYNPWSVVHVVFAHLAEQGLHPVLGETGDPGPPGHAPARGPRHRAGGGGQPRGDARAYGRTSSSCASPCSRTSEAPSRPERPRRPGPVST